MDDAINISALNDFTFCPVSIYFHNLYGNQAKDSYQCSDQINGADAHSAIDSAFYSSNPKVLQGIGCFCEKYNLVGKIDLFDQAKGILTERKRKIVTIFDGYIFQLYAQYFSLKEMGYEVSQIRLYSYADNKIYRQDLPENNHDMLRKFEELILSIKSFSMENFEQLNAKKCLRCIYAPACDRSLI